MHYDHEIQEMPETLSSHWYLNSFVGMELLMSNAFGVNKEQDRVKQLSHVLSNEGYITLPDPWKHDLALAFRYLVMPRVNWALVLKDLPLNSMDQGPSWQSQ